MEEQPTNDYLQQPQEGFEKRLTTNLDPFHREGHQKQLVATTHQLHI